MKTQRSDNRSGVALVTVVCFAFLVSALVAAILSASVFHYRAAVEQRYLEQALYVAQSGVERAAYALGQSVSLPYSFHGGAGEGVYVVTIIDGATPAAGWHSLGGDLMINPNNSPDSAFIAHLPDGSTITRYDLTQNYPGYVGMATNVLFKPKGGGFQNGLQVDGAPYPVENDLTYMVESPSMAINIFNDKVNQSGKAVGRWHISVASTSAKINAVY